MTRARQRDARAAQGAGPVADRGGAGVAGAARAVRPRGQGARRAGPAVGRPAAAGGDRAGARDAAGPAAARRGHLRARPGARRRGARRHPRARRRRHDDGHRDPRDGLRARHREPGLLPRRGPDPRAGAAGADLRGAPRGADPPVPHTDHRGGRGLLERSRGSRHAVRSRRCPAATAATLSGSRRPPARVHEEREQPLELAGRPVGPLGMRLDGHPERAGARLDRLHQVPGRARRQPAGSEPRRQLRRAARPGGGSCSPGPRRRRVGREQDPRQARARDDAHRVGERGPSTHTPGPRAPRRAGGAARPRTRSSPGGRGRSPARARPRASAAAHAADSSASRSGSTPPRPSGTAP